MASSLAPPPPPPIARSRASSTSVRPPLSLQSLATRTRSSSLSQPGPAPPSHSSPSPTSSSPASSYPPSPDEQHKPLESASTMFPVLVLRCVQLVRSLRPGASPKYATLFSSPPSSPRSSTDSDYILPLSASHTKTSFNDVLSPPPISLRLPSIHAPLLLVLIIFPLSTLLTLYSLSTLPIIAAWPRTLSDFAQLGRDLSMYAQSGAGPTLHVLAVLAVSALWKHAWSVPGSVLWNVLAGALFHPILAILVMTSLTTIGSVFSTLLAAPLAPILGRLFPRPIEMTRAVLEGSVDTASEVMEERKGNAQSQASSSGRAPAWVRLSVLRLVGVVPWSGLNIACGLTGVSLRDCAAGAFIGTLPWTAVTCQVGNILRTVGAVSMVTPDGATNVVSGISSTATVSSVLASPQMILELVFLSVLSLAPILGRSHLRRLVSPNSDDVSNDGLELDDSSTFDDSSEPLITEKPRPRQRHTRRWSNLSLSWTSSSLSKLFSQPEDATR